METNLRRKCKSLRFEDRKKCLSDACDGSWYCAHHGEVAVCLALNRTCDEIITQEIPQIEREKYKDVIREVEEYMYNFRKSILNSEHNDARYWWMAKGEKKKRVLKHCQSLELSTGKLCEALKLYRQRFCSNHQLQHDLLCAAYHMRIDMRIYGVSDNTTAFVEFVLRKEFNWIFITIEDLGHRQRLGHLWSQMIRDPYPEVNLKDVDASYYNDAKKVYNAKPLQSKL